MGAQASLLLLGTTETALVSFVNVFTTVYSLLILGYIILQLIPPGSLGGTSGLHRFLHDVCSPYLAVFRRFVPPLGPLDLSPMVAVFVLVLINRALVALISGVF
ncbi:MAG: YggT family protein [Gaiellales bacterium]